MKESSAQEEDENIDIEEIPVQKPKYQNKKLKSLLLKINKRRHQTENNSFAESIEAFSTGTLDGTDKEKKLNDFKTPKEIHSPYLNVKNNYSPLSPIKNS